MNARSLYQRLVKRAIDVFLAAVGLLVAFIPMLIVALIIKLDSPGPVIFKQQRLGHAGKEFTFYKFRSMCVGAENTGSGVYSYKNDSRVTKIGRILRATSIDEIPQLINILKGDMSFVGPRPPLTYHPWTLEEYSEEQLKMFNVRPGVTGWAQINGRKCVEWNKRIEMNVWYSENVSFLLDLKIFFKTVIKVISNSNNENVEVTVVTDSVLEPSLQTVNGE